jgi:diguanylate cyclase (GGDEF)-like protein
MKWLYILKKKILFIILGIMSVSIICTMLFIALMLRNSMIDESKIKSQELGNAVQTTLNSLMMTRNPELLQDTVEEIGLDNYSVVRAFIINKDGRVVYSSDKNIIGKNLDKDRETTCLACHGKSPLPSESTTIINMNGRKLLRSVRVIFNEEKCFGCHTESDRINGKFIIDHSLKSTYMLISYIELMIFASGIFCIIVLIPILSRVLSREVNKYIDEIMQQNVELNLLYTMIERLSETIDLEELKTIVIEIIKDSLKADEINIIFPKTGDEYRVNTWSSRDDAVRRKKIDKKDPLSATIDDWLKGKIIENTASKDNKVIYMPIRKSDKNIALITIQKTENSFENVPKKLIEIMSSHISVAFENAYLYHIAITDELTDLYTQRHFRTSIIEKFLETKKLGSKLSLLFIDIDDFKMINDRHGHMVGDSVLKNVARHILSSIRDNDLAFRYGGEEFAVILPSTDHAVAYQVAERVREDIASSVFEKGTLNIIVTVSIGISVYPEDADSIRDLISTADKALYKAKQSGKNKVAGREISI